MALQNLPAVFKLILKDRGGNTAPMIFKSNITSQSVAQDMLTALLIAIPSLSKAKVIQATYSLGQVEDDQTIGTGNGEIEERASINLALVADAGSTGQTKYAEIAIPAPVDGLFQATSGRLYNVVDPTNATLQTLLDFYTAGWGISGSLTLSDGQTIEDPTVAGNVNGKRTHRRSRKG